jgi:hypothetical protein
MKNSQDSELIFEAYMQVLNEFNFFKGSKVINVPSKPLALPSTTRSAIVPRNSTTAMVHKPDYIDIKAQRLSPDVPKNNKLMKALGGAAVGAGIASAFGDSESTPNRFDTGAYASSQGRSGPPDIRPPQGSSSPTPSNIYGDMDKEFKNMSQGLQGTIQKSPETEFNGVKFGRSSASTPSSIYDDMDKEFKNMSQGYQGTIQKSPETEFNGVKFGRSSASTPSSPSNSNRAATLAYRRAAGQENLLNRPSGLPSADDFIRDNSFGNSASASTSPARSKSTTKKSSTGLPAKKYSPVETDQQDDYNPPGTMVSRGLQSAGRGIGKGIRSIAGAAAAPFKGAKFSSSPDRVRQTYGSFSNLGSQEAPKKASYKPLFNKGGLFNR